MSDEPAGDRRVVDGGSEPAAQTAVDTARGQIGKAYQYGAAGPDSYGCSGLTQYAYRPAGLTSSSSTSL